jgi:hypothetical protein
MPEWGTYAGAASTFVLAIVWVALAVFVWAKLSSESLGIGIFSILFVIGACVCVVVGVRMLRAGLRIDSNGVTVRGVIKTTRVPLREIEAFAPRDFGLGGTVRTTVGVTLQRRRAHDLIVWSMRHGEFTGRASRENAIARWQPVCDELNALISSFPDSAVRSAATN